jgi:hypothetical protein
MSMNGNDDDDDGADAVAVAYGDDDDDNNDDDDDDDDNNKHIPKSVDTRHEYKLTTLVKIKNCGPTKPSLSLSRSS